MGLRVSGLTGLPWGKKLAAVVATAAISVAGAAAAGLSANAAEADEPLGTPAQELENEMVGVLVPDAGAPEEAEADYADAAAVKEEPGVAADAPAFDEPVEAATAGEEPVVPEETAPAGEGPAVPEDGARAGEETTAPEQTAPQSTQQAPTPEVTSVPSEEPGTEAQGIEKESIPASQAPPGAVLSAQEKGTFQVKVVVEGGPASAATHDFQVYWVCMAPEGKTYFADMKVKGDGVAVGVGTHYTVGTKCWVAQAKEDAHLDGYAVEFDSEQAVLIEAGKTPVVEFTNKYTTQFGSFAVKKTVSGGPAGAADASYPFAWYCGDISGDLSVKGDGVAVPANFNIPAGTQCTINEFFSSPIDGFLPIQPEAKTIAIEAGKTTVVEFENKFTDQYGILKLKKTVKGGPASNSMQFLLRIKCGETKASTMMPEGVFYIDIPVPAGVECTVSEDADKAQIPGYDLAVPKDVTVTIVAGETVIAEVVNEYQYVSPQPSVTPSQTATPTVKPSETATPSVVPSTSAFSHSKGKDGKFEKGASLARTGSDAIVAGSIAVALLAGGVVLIAVRRNRSK